MNIRIFLIQTKNCRLAFYLNSLYQYACCHLIISAAVAASLVHHVLSQKTVLNSINKSEPFKQQATLEETRKGESSPNLLETFHLLGSQKKLFCEALIDAFRSPKDLEMMLSYELDWQLNQIAGGENYREIVFNLIKYADAQGQIIKLLEAAKRANPGNLKLRNFYLL